ncbi:DegT/DnrJ/EryC1/StrS family aminotransferase [Halobellus salinisoli]|uniref:DegT/DnrJ/EryC1/StrS family aminotransferase n=1 Tax=Halobellus salinisoli TaxID=3108500 RepID=UPI00300B507F
MTHHVAPIRPRFRFSWLLDPCPRSIGWLDDDSWIPRGHRRVYRWAKQGLTAAFETVKPEETVLLPAYAPGGVTWAARNAGLDVRYYPVSADLTLPLAEIRQRIRSIGPAAIQVIHYFGFVDEGFDELVSIAHEHDALVIEDCARGLFGRDENGRLLGSRGDFAVFCPHKTLPVPDGGIVVSQTDARLPEAPPTWNWRHDAQYLFGSLRDRIPVDLVPEALLGQFHSSDAEEVAPEESLAGPSPLTSFGLARCQPAAVRSARQARYRVLRALLDGSDEFRVLSGDVYDGACPYGVVGIADSATARQQLFRELQTDGLPCEALTWPPVYRHEEVHGFEESTALRNQLLVLPTHQQLSWSTIGRIAAHVIEW